MDYTRDAAAEELLDGGATPPDPEDRPMSAAEVMLGLEVAAYLLLCRAPS